MSITKDEERKYFLILVDTIFAVLIGASFINFNTQLVPLQLEFQTAAIIVAFFIIILSWFGYHNAIVKQQLEIKWKIIIDLLLLYVYFYILFSSGNFPHYVLGVCIMFGLYLIWTIARDDGKRGNNTWKTYYTDIGNKVKLGRAIGIFIASIALWLLYHYITSPDYSVKETVSDSFFDGFILAIIVILVISYRAIPEITKRKN